MIAYQSEIDLCESLYVCKITWFITYWLHTSLPWLAYSIIKEQIILMEAMPYPLPAFTILPQLHRHGVAHGQHVPGRCPWPCRSGLGIRSVTQEPFRKAIVWRRKNLQGCYLGDLCVNLPKYKRTKWLRSNHPLVKSRNSYFKTTHDFPPSPSKSSWTHLSCVSSALDAQNEWVNWFSHPFSPVAIFSMVRVSASDCPLGPLVHDHNLPAVARTAGSAFISIPVRFSLKKLHFLTFLHLTSFNLSLSSCFQCRPNGSVLAHEDSPGNLNVISQVLFLGCQTIVYLS